jgi:hypothetical protein
LKPLILFTHSDGLDIHDINVGRRPTGDAGVPSGGQCGNDNGDEQGFGCGKIVLVGSVSDVSVWLPTPITTRKTAIDSIAIRSALNIWCAAGIYP